MKEENPGRDRQAAGMRPFQCFVDVAEAMQLGITRSRSIPLNACPISEKIEGRIQPE